MMSCLRLVQALNTQESCDIGDKNNTKPDKSQKLRN